MKTLIAYYSRSGSTRAIAEWIKSEVEAKGAQVELKSVLEVDSLEDYDWVIAGGLLYRLGWHPAMLRFLRRQRAALSARKCAFFVSGLRLTPTAALENEDFPIFIDPAIAHAPTHPGRLTPVEWFTTLPRYLGPALPLLREIRPLSLAFFAGSLQLFSLSPFERLTAVLLMALTGIQPGDHRSAQAVREWASSLSASTPASCGETP